MRQPNTIKKKLLENAPRQIVKRWSLTTEKWTQVSNGYGFILMVAFISGLFTTLTFHWVRNDYAFWTSWMPW